MSKTLSSKLLDKTKLLLRNRKKLTLKEIAEETGIDEGWLKSFLNNSSLNHPSVCRIETLYNFLSETPLDI